MAHGDPNDDFLVLEILRRVNLATASREAEELAANPDLRRPGSRQSAFMSWRRMRNIWPTMSSRLVAETILGLVERFERAPGSRSCSTPRISRLVQFNRGLILLRLGQHREAQRSLHLRSCY